MSIVDEEYIKKSENWAFALGLIKVDGLIPSEEMLALIEKEKCGEITTKDIRKAIIEKYNKA